MIFLNKIFVTLTDVTNGIYKHDISFQMICCSTRYRIIKSISILIQLYFASAKFPHDKFFNEKYDDKYAFLIPKFPEQPIPYL